MDASDALTLNSDFKSLAQAKGVGTTEEDGLRYLAGRKDEWVLILDNADDPNFNLRPYLAWLNGNVIITTRNPQLRVHAPDCHLQVDKLELKEAIELLLRGSVAIDSAQTQKIASEIVEVRMF